MSMKALTFCVFCETCFQL